MKGWLHYPAQQLRKAPRGADMRTARDLSEQAAQVAGPTDAGHWPNRPTATATGNPWGNAGQPWGISAPIEQPFIFDYPHGINLIAQPRSGFGLHSFAQLRLLADACEEIRLPVELMKREVRALEWDIAPREDAEPAHGQLQAARARIAQPDHLVSFDGWINLLIEELMVTDAVTLYPNTQRGGALDALELIDGATIRPLLDARGRTPAPPLPAYTQVIKGYPVGQWDREALWYLPYNRSLRHPYGRPPVEIAIITVNTAIRRATNRLGQYTEGNIPEALVGLPADWSVNDITAFQEYWDALLAADEQRLQRMKFFPVGGTGQPPVYEFQRSDGTTTVLDEWLLRVGCWAVGVSPSEFGLVPGDGLGGSGFAEGQADIQYRMGLGPMTQYIKGILDQALTGWGFETLEFKWMSTERPQDALLQAQIDQIRLSDGVYSLEYVQEREGVPPEMRPEEPPRSASPFDPFQFAPPPRDGDAKEADDENENPAADEGGAAVQRFFRQGGWERYG